MASETAGLTSEAGTHERVAADVSALWEEFARTKCRAVRDQLVVHYGWLVRHVLSRLAISLPPSLDYSDLVGYGSIALVEAVERFEPERGYKFETYAALRVKGAILDAIRTMDLVSRPVRRRMRQVSDAVQDLTRELGRAPTDAELASSLGISVRDLYNTYRHGAATVISLDTLPAQDYGEEGSALYELVPDQSGTGPDRGGTAIGADRFRRRSSTVSASARSGSPLAVLQRGPQYARDWRGPGHIRVSRLPDTHQGRALLACVPEPARRAHRAPRSPRISEGCFRARFPDTLMLSVNSP